MKYKLTRNKRDGLTQIIACKSFSDVKKGELGGWVKGTHNLSQEGNCWIYDDAAVIMEARLEGNAIVTDSACVTDRSRVSGNSRVSDHAFLKNQAIVAGQCVIQGYTVVADSARLMGKVHLKGHAKVHTLARLSGEITVCDRAVIGGMIYLHAETSLVISGRTNLKPNEGITITRQENILHIDNLRYPLTIIPGFVYGGCRTFTHEEFRKLTLKKCYDIEWTAHELKVYKSFLRNWEAMQNIE